MNGGSVPSKTTLVTTERRSLSPSLEFCGRILGEGREPQMPAPSGLITYPQQNQIAHAASPPTLAKQNARIGHPQWGMVRAKIVKGGPPASAKRGRSASTHGPFLLLLTGKFTGQRLSMEASLRKLLPKLSSSKDVSSVTRRSDSSLV
jgi:hypothetical protein